MPVYPDLTKAMILAAGKGTRLYPSTLEVPKILLPMAGKPLLAYVLTWLKLNGITDAAINLYHLGDKVKEFLGDGRRYGIKILYSEEETLLGTAGGVKKVETFFNSTFLVIYGDLLLDFNLERMLHFHRKNHAIATLLLAPVSNPKEVGIVKIDEKGKVLSFVEKPSSSAATGNLANGGVYILEKEIFKHIPEGIATDFAYDVFPKMIQLGLPVYGYVPGAGESLIDIGTRERYERANERLTNGTIKISFKV
jgi:NDP-sugar pyrophosphorylase family protein